MRTTLATSMALVITLAMGLQPVGAVNGDLDGNAHPNVGVMLVADANGEWFEFCGGVLISPTAFLTNYNDFLWPVYVLFSPEAQTLPAGLSTLQSANSVRYDLLMAGAVVASIPVLLLYLIAQRFVIEGVSRSGLKG